MTGTGKLVQIYRCEGDQFVAGDGRPVRRADLTDLLRTLAALEDQPAP